MRVHPSMNFNAFKKNNAMKNLFSILLIVMIFVVANSCRKSKISPLCWGEKEDALLINEGVSCGYFIVPKSSNKRYKPSNQIPKDFLQLESGDTLAIRIKYKMVEGRLNTNQCTMNYLKILCMQKK